MNYFIRDCKMVIFPIPFTFNIWHYSVKKSFSSLIEDESLFILKWQDQCLILSLPIFRVRSWCHNHLQLWWQVSFLNYDLTHGFSLTVNYIYNSLWCSSHPKFGQWEPPKVGSCILLTTSTNWNKYHRDTASSMKYSFQKLQAFRISNSQEIQRLEKQVTQHWNETDN